MTKRRSGKSATRPWPGRFPAMLAVAVAGTLAACEAVRAPPPPAAAGEAAAVGESVSTPQARAAATRRESVSVGEAAAVREAVTTPQARADSSAPQAAGLSDAQFAALVARISEAGGYFDTDNLISNETSYLKVMDALDRLGIRGGAYVGVGPDQNFSYIARIRPAVAFITDVRRDNLLHHLLLKALMERAPTRVAFLAALHGRTAPPDAPSWRERGIEEALAYVDATPVDPGVVAALHEEIERAVTGFGIPLSEEDHATIRRFHQTFIDAGLSLRFTTFGRPPRPYYPTYRQLLLETDVDGDRASYLASPDAYEAVRALQLANMIVPVVGDMAGPSALREMAAVLAEMGLELTAFYASNVEFYLWRARTFERWVDNLDAFPLAPRAVIIRSYFPNSGGGHPSAIPGYYSTQTLQPVRTLLGGGFSSYWEVVTREAVELR